MKFIKRLAICHLIILKLLLNIDLLNEYKEELLDGIITVEEIENVINILNEKGPATFDNIGKLYINDKDMCDYLVKKTVEPYIFVTEHFPVELWNQFFERAIGQNEPMNWLNDKYKLIITIDDAESLDMGEPIDHAQKETFVACWNRLVSMGISEMHIMAVMANVYAESRYSATNAEDGFGYNGWQSEMYPDDDWNDPLSKWVKAASHGLVLSPQGTLNIFPVRSQREYPQMGYGLLFHNGEYFAVRLPECR